MQFGASIRSSIQARATCTVHGEGRAFHRSSLLPKELDMRLTQ
jgi:hypothetical protein